MAAEDESTKLWARVELKPPLTLIQQTSTNIIVESGQLPVWRDDWLEV
jgi:hypothetical protein